MFLHLSVSHSVQRGGLADTPLPRVDTCHQADTPTWADTCTWADTARPGRHHPLGRQPPPPEVHTPKHTPSPLKAHPLPLEAHPSGSSPPPSLSPTATAADGTHPTGMLSCS